MEEQQPGLELFAEYQERLLTEWRELRRNLGESGCDMIAILVREDVDGDVRMLLGPRQDVVESLTAHVEEAEGIEELRMPAYQKDPGTPKGLAIWVVVYTPKGASVMRVLDLPMCKGGDA